MRHGFCSESKDVEGNRVNLDNWSPLLEKCPLDFFYKIKGAVLNRYTFSLLSIGEKVYLFKLAHFFSSIQIFFNVQNIFAGQRASLEKRAQFIQFKVFLLATGHRATDRYSA